jgi:hypothetical protein
MYVCLKLISNDRLLVRIIAGVSTAHVLVPGFWGSGVVREITQDVGTFLVGFQGFCLGRAACLLSSPPTSSR